MLQELELGFSDQHLLKEYCDSKCILFCSTLFFDSTCIDPFTTQSPFLYSMDKLDSHNIDDSLDWSISEFLFSSRL